MEDQPPSPRTALLRLGTRGSKLALAQAQEVRERLAQAWPELAAPDAVAIEVIRTTGDIVRDRPLAEIGGKGLFMKEIEEALLGGGIDAAIHSMKDVETFETAGTTIAAVLPREDPRDVLVSPRCSGLADLPHGAVVGTASVRRRALLLHRRPDLKVVLFRGNVDTRLGKLAAGEADATLLALCGLKRLGMADRATAVLDVATMPPAVAQGALCVQCRDGDDRARAWLAAIDHGPSRARVTAERAMLAALDGSCRTPIAGLADIDGDGIALDGYVVRLDGARLHPLTDRAAVPDAARLGTALGQQLKALAGPDLAI